MFIHTVQRGDTLWLIAKEHQISLDALLAANPQIADPNYILPGTNINVPGLVEMEPNPPGEEIPEPLPESDCFCQGASARPCIYITKDGETLQNISLYWQVPLAQLHYYNYQYTQNMPLPAGERIIIPPAANYQVQPQPQPRRRRR